MNQRSRVILNDDHAVERGGLRTVLGDEDDLVVVADSANARAAAADRRGARASQCST